MPTARVSRTLPATSAAIWRLAADPKAMAQWWPRCVRVERVSVREFTQVLRTPRGRDVRADFRVTEQDQGRRRVWTQQIDGTPFERYFASSITELRLTPKGDETTVTLEQRQRLRGVSRFGGFLTRRASRATLREALDALEQALG
jgi:uncharacterized protein YndB with AHSA1/START domain